MTESGIAPFAKYQNHLSYQYLTPYRCSTTNSFLRPAPLQNLYNILSYSVSHRVRKIPVQNYGSRLLPRYLAKTGCNGEADATGVVDGSCWILISMGEI